MEKLFLKKLLKDLSTETFTAKFWDGTFEKFGQGEAKFKIVFNRPVDKKAILEDSSLAFGEAYMNKDIELEGNIQKIIESIYKNKDSFLHSHKFLNRLLKLRGTSIKKQKEDISYHYDLGNDFYSLWLDKNMNYSCAYFKDKDDSLDKAQDNKIKYILKKLNLKEGQTLLDIGCGWGDLIIEASEKYKVKSLGITLSKEQYKKAQDKIKAKGLENLAEVKLMDYRELPTKKMKFDRIVSVGMLEHVGHGNIPSYIDIVDKILEKRGIMLLHAITGLYETEGNRWIKKYIFPGGYIPTIREIVETFSEHDIHLVDLESLRLHYSKTLECWAENFEDSIDKVKEKFDEKFIRMWRLYLNSCAASFHYGVVDVHQFLITKDLNNEIPMTREYLYK
ncbi:cyclopropane-fatty-acyl-phospholipid synthase family protein [Clostridium oceanicum]|uniref:Cyclopropane-fatty-acyl-phospholipid synthase family protein n=1 Tax=Clostridium oceanicum TaxID=1543 RepID=A0ABN1JIW6_9CLOT